MTRDEFDLFWAPARDALYPLPSPTATSRLKASYQMREALGARATKEHTDFFKTVVGSYPMDEELKKVLRLLNSPYAQTILKAYRIRKGLEVV